MRLQRHGTGDGVSWKHDRNTRIVAQVAHALEEHLVARKGRTVVVSGRAYGEVRYIGFALRRDM